MTWWLSRYMLQAFCLILKLPRLTLHFTGWQAIDVIWAQILSICGLNDKLMLRWYRLAMKHDMNSLKISSGSYGHALITSGRKFYFMLTSRHNALLLEKANLIFRRAVGSCAAASNRRQNALRMRLQFLDALILKITHARAS